MAGRSSTTTRGEFHDDYGYAFTLDPGPVTIREATEADLPRCIEMGEAFMRGTIYGTLFPPAPGAVARLARKALDTGVIFVAEQAGLLLAGLALVVMEQPFTGAMYADELTWWTDTEARGQLRVGVRLLQHAEQWARENDLSMVQMAAPAESRVGAFRAHRGYRPVETTYTLRL